MPGPSVGVWWAPLGARSQTANSSTREACPRVQHVICSFGLFVQDGEALGYRKEAQSWRTETQAALPEDKGLIVLELPHGCPTR